MSEMRTDAEEPAELTVQERRYQRMKHLRVDDVRLSEMVPILIEEGLLPEHENHASLPPVTKGRRSDERNAEICARCEHTIGQQWRDNIHRLKLDQVMALEARWIWERWQEKIASEAWKDHRQHVVITTVKRRKLEPARGETWPVLIRDADGNLTEAMIACERIESPAFIVETTERSEERIYPGLYDLTSEVLDKLARVRGVQLEKVDPRERDLPHKKMIVRRHGEPRTSGDGPTN